MLSEFLPDPEISYAVFIGSASYNTLTPLPGVTNNLDRLNALFTSQAVWNLPSDHCTVLHEPTTSLEAAKAVRHAAQEAKGALFVYFAGHGLVDRDTGDLHLALPSSEEHDPHLTALPYDWVRREVLRSPALHRIVTLDCCFSGRALGMMSEHSAKSAIDRAEIDRTYLMAAAAENSTAIAPEGDTYTSFTGELIHALANGVDNGSPLLDLDTLHALTENGLNAKGYPPPQCRDRNQAGRTPFARNAAYTNSRRIPDPKSVPGSTSAPRDSSDTDSPAEDLVQRLGCLDIDNPGNKKLEVLVDGVSVGDIGAGRQARFHIATGTRFVQTRIGEEYSEARRVEISSQSRMRISYALTGDGKVESNDRIEFAANWSSWSLLFFSLPFLTVPILPLLLPGGEWQWGEGNFWLVALYPFWYGVMFFVFKQLTWLTRLELSNAGVACTRFKRKEITWREVDWIGIQKEGSVEKLVFWPYGSSRSRPPKLLGRLDNITEECELGEIRGAMTWFAGNRYIEHP